MKGQGRQGRGDHLAERSTLKTEMKSATGYAPSGRVRKTSGAQEMGSSMRGGEQYQGVQVESDSK